jgi:hypothetical protein
MRKSAWLLVTVLSALAYAGCSKPKLDSQTPDYYARDIKRDVHNFVQAAKTNPKIAGQEGAILLEKLEAYPTQPVGDYEEIYAQLAAKCKELVEAANRKAPAAEISAKLNQLAALANKLPGDLTESR